MCGILPNKMPCLTKTNLINNKNNDWQSPTKGVMNEKEIKISNK
jgi:hypothetical protein